MMEVMERYMQEKKNSIGPFISYIDLRMKSLLAPYRLVTRSTTNVRINYAVTQSIWRKSPLSGIVDLVTHLGGRGLIAVEVMNLQLKILSGVNEKNESVVLVLMRGVAAYIEKFSEKPRPKLIAIPAMNLQTKISTGILPLLGIKLEVVKSAVVRPVELGLLQLGRSLRLILNTLNLKLHTVSMDMNSPLLDMQSNILAVFYVLSVLGIRLTLKMLLREKPLALNHTEQSAGMDTDLRIYTMLVTGTLVGNVLDLGHLNMLRNVRQNIKSLALSIFRGQESLIFSKLTALKDILMRIWNRSQAEKLAFNAGLRKLWLMERRLEFDFSYAE